MQQASTVVENSNTPAAGDAPVPPASLRNLFVINLCASTTPVALTPPDHAGLKRFTFFVSRRREEGRERFRLHMGYFESQEEAERLLDIVREIYPGAWAGLAPGQRLRAKAQAEARLTAAGEPAVAAAAAAPAAADAAAPVQRPAAADVATEPQAQAGATARAELPAQVPAGEAARPSEAVESALALVPDEGRRVPVEPNGMREKEAAVRALSNVRAAIASLEDSSVSTPTLRPLPELKPANSATGAHRVLATTGTYKSLLTEPAGAPAARATPTPETRELSDTAALRVLESKAAADAAAATVIQPPRPPMPNAATRPSDARPAEEKTAYAVQLLWSVQPIDIAHIPQLAIFSAYTLYGAEGNRDGRRWYGVRLGFFTDAVSAKQVAHYVRSDFSTVSVVPVTARERERAKLAAARPDATPVAAASASVPASVPASASPAAPEDTRIVKPGFEFIDDKQPTLPARTGVAGDGSAVRGTRGAPGKRAKLRRPVSGRAKSKPMTLEETLEILGAGELQVDDGRRPLINEAARPAAREPVKGKSSRFGRLLERLSERLGS